MKYKRSAFLKELWQNTDGIILPYVTVMLVVIIGISVLALDGARYMSLQTQLQNDADALALAAAAELDRTPTAISRAETAIQKFGSDQRVRIESVKFLSSLPVRDSDPILPAHVTEDATRAAFIEVVVAPFTMHTVLPASFFGGANVVSVGAQAVAGFDQVVCDFTPIFICNPFETQGMSYSQATQALVSANNDPAAQRRLISLVGTQHAHKPFGPGNFGYLIPTSGSLPSESCGPTQGSGLAKALAASRPPICLRLSGVDLQPGDDEIAIAGLNTRFDIYAKGFELCKDNYVADVNVRKGYLTIGNANWCAAQPSGSNWPVADPNAAALPVDSNMLLNTDGGPKLNISIAVGDGTWDCASYWSVAHSAGPGRDLPPAGCTNAAKISRYSVYQYEMNYITDRSPGSEMGEPQCNPRGIKYRRVLNAAIINCGSEAPSGNSRNVPVAAFGRFFLTLPATLGASPYAEFLGLIQPTDPINHDMVQLYR